MSKTPAPTSNGHDPLSLPMLLTAVLMSVMVASAVAVWPTPGKLVGVVFAPGVTQREAVNRVAVAGGRIVDIGGLSNVVIAIGSHDGFFRDLFSEGALVLLDGRLTSALCFTSRN